MRDNVGKNKKARPTDFLMPSTEYVEKSLQEQRFSICAECPELIKLTNQCKAHAECPAGKWDSVSG